MSISDRQLTLRWAALLGLAMLAAVVVQARAFWPGVMMPDAIEEYRQALAGVYDDWHPPAVAWTWHQLLRLAPGPGPMLLLQLVLYWGGLALLAAWALRGGRRWLAAGSCAVGLYPIGYGLLGSALKDGLLTGALLTGAGLVAWTEATGRWRYRLPAILILVYAAALRANAAFAVVPLLLALLPADWRKAPLRLLLAACVATPLLLATGPIAGRLLDAKQSHFTLVLLLYDLGGITERSGADVLPPMGFGDNRAANHRCYDTLQWDSYSEPCPITYESFDEGFKAGGRSPYSAWAQAILHHPLAYAAHRLAHFNRNIRWLVPEDLRGATYVTSDVNPWQFSVEPSGIQHAIYWAALWTSETPAGWPCVWMAVSVGLLVAARGLPSYRMIAALAASGLLYGLGYLVIGISSDLRYHLWTMMAAILALAIFASESAAARWLWVVAPAGLVAITAAFARLQ